MRRRLQWRFGQVHHQVEIKDGVITATVGDANSKIHQDRSLTPTPTSSGNLSWKCTYADAKYLPVACRGT
jgi:hypothetical protein